MKKLLSLLVAGFLLTSCGKQDYEGGRDTERSFGNGRFQILRVAGSRPLMDVKTGKVILTEVIDFKRDGTLSNDN
jgi:hypothetical protein